MEAIILEVLYIKYDMFEKQPKCLEVVEYITKERTDIIENHDEAVRSLVAEILAQGNRTGEFDVRDIVAGADIFLKATILLYWPYLMNIYSLEQLEYYAKEIVRMLVEGLKKR